MNIGVAAMFRAHGGSLKNLQQLISCWRADGTFDRHRFIFYTSAETSERLRDVLPEAARIRVLVPPGGNWLRRLVAEHHRLPRAIREDGVDVLYSPANTLPFRAGAPMVVNFNNFAPFCPLESGWWRSRAGWRDAIRRLLLRGLIRQAARRAQRVITNANHFRDTLVKTSRVPADRITVIERACPLPGKSTAERMAQVMQANGLNDPFVLSVGHLYPYRNIESLLRAFAVALGRLKTDQKVLLVLVGGCYLPGYQASLEQTARDCGVASRVRFVGALPPEDVHVLMDAARAFVFSSTCENCPNALLEAMAHGCAIVTSATPPMPEFAGDAALIADPRKPEEFGEELARLLNSPELADKLRNRALQRSQRYASVDDMARRTLEAITSPVLSNPRRRVS